MSHHSSYAYTPFGNELSFALSLKLAIHSFTKDIRTSAVWETLAFLSAMVVLNMILGDGSRFIAMAPHPFWLIILFVTIQYGIKEAVLAAMLSSLFLLVGNMPEQHLTESNYDYVMRAASLPLLWVGAAFILGALRTKQLAEKKHLQTRAERAETAAHSITNAYHNIKKAKEALELRLAQESNSMLHAYQTAKSVYANEDAGDAIMALIRSSLNPEKCSFYRLEKGNFYLQRKRGWEKTDEYIRHFAADSALAQTMRTQNRMLCLSKVGDEALLEKEGMLAGPVVNPATGKMYGMLKIESVDFLKFNNRTLEMFRMLCEWSGQICAQAEQITPQQVIRENKKAHRDTRTRSTVPYRNPVGYSNHQPVSA